jgi:hypothetical protein
MSKPTRKSAGGKVGKPRPGFPLFLHASGNWAKKVKGRMCYFGKLADDPRGEAALDLWLAQRDDLLASRIPRTKADQFTLRDLCNQFLSSKRSVLESGKLSPRSFADYLETSRQLIDFFGKHRPVDDLMPTDFGRYHASMTKAWGPVTVGNMIRRTRVVFNYAVKNGLIPGIHYGSEFAIPKKKVLRAERAKQSSKMFEPVELRRIIAIVGQPMKAMILLALNCGLGNQYCAVLPRADLDFKRGWLAFPRPKTAVLRHASLWRETVAALRESLA